MTAAMRPAALILPIGGGSFHSPRGSEYTPSDSSSCRLFPPTDPSSCRYLAPVNFGSGSTPCAAPPGQRRVCFSSNADVVVVTPYSKQYGMHPRLFDFDSEGQMIPNTDGARKLATEEAYERLRRKSCATAVSSAPSMPTEQPVLARGQPMLKRSATLQPTASAAAEEDDDGDGPPPMLARSRGGNLSSAVPQSPSAHTAGLPPSPTLGPTPASPAAALYPSTQLLQTPWAPVPSCSPTLGARRPLLRKAHSMPTAQPQLGQLSQSMVICGSPKPASHAAPLRMGSK